jgi:aldose sugar dehydrogenase
MGTYSVIWLLLFVWITYVSVSASLELTNIYHYPTASGQGGLERPDLGPFLRDSVLKVEPVFTGINFPTSMAFLGNDDILVLEKNEGTVRRILNGTMLEDPLLKVNVSSAGERGMLGIAIANNSNTNNTLTKPPYVFLYFTDGGTNKTIDNQSPLIRNKLYRYEFVEGKLVNPKLLLDLPSGHAVLHNGGVVSIGTDNNVYIIVGDMLGKNPQDSELLTGTSGVLRIDQDGNPVKNEEGQYVLGNTHPSNKYYSYGIRNSFGMDFDPVTGNLWDTENGPQYGDEINLVEQGSNGGWATIQGFWTGSSPKQEDTIFSPDPQRLVNFGGKLVYSAPELAVYPTIGLTAISFLSTDNYGEDYKNDILVGDFHNGNLYRLELNENRKQLQLSGQLADKVANNLGDLKDVLLGWGFGGITDIEIGPDGNAYILSLFQGGKACNQEKSLISNCIRYDLNGTEPGTIFRISSKESS